MATFEERYYQNTRARHMNQLRNLAKRIQDSAGYALARLEADAVPQTYSLAEDVREFVTRVAVLDALTELKGVYDLAEPESAPDDPVLHEMTTTTYCPRCGKDHGSQDYVDHLNAQEG